jgi:tetratricopeptide (TPR) repeat protein
VAAFLLEREDLLKGGRQPESLAEIGSDLRNGRAAWQWAVGAGRADLIRPMVGPLFLFHELRGWFQEGADLFQSALALPDPGLRATSRARVGRFAYRLGRYPEAEAALEAALAEARAASDIVEEAFALNNLGLVALGLGRPAEAREHLRRTLQLVREGGNRWATANALYNLGLTAMALGAYAEARSHFQEALDLYQELRDARGTSLALSGLGQALGVMGEDEAAQDLFTRGAVVGERLPDPFAAATRARRLTT